MEKHHRPRFKMITHIFSIASTAEEDDDVEVREGWWIID